MGVKVSYTLVQFKGFQYPFWAESNGYKWIDPISFWVSRKKQRSDRIICVVDTNSYENLDWSITELGLMHGTGIGWLDGSGRLYECRAFLHDAFALLILRKIGLGLVGYCRIHGSGNYQLEYGKSGVFCPKLTIEQSTWLEKHNYEIHDACE